MRYSIGKNTFDNRPQNREATSFFDFGKAVLGARSAKKGETYICAPFNGDGLRKKDGALPRAWLPFDFDMIADQETFAELCLYFGRYKGFGYTTASHTDQKPRARAILSASREMDRAECRRVCLAIERDIKSKFGERVGMDASVYRAEQPVYTPLRDAKSFLWVDGDDVDVDAVLETAPELEAEFSSSARLDESALADPVLQRLYDRKMIRKDLGNGRFGVVCPMESEHTSASGETSTVYMLPHFSGVRYGKFHCLHSHCEKRPQEEFLRALSLDPKAVWATQSPRTEQQQKQPAKGPSIQTIDARELSEREFQPLKWAVPGILPEGVTLLAGAPKLGKSWWALDVSIAIASGGYVFGSIQVDPGEALYLALEDNERRMNSRLKKALRGGECPEGLHIATSAPRVDEGLIDALREFCDAHPDLRLIIVDTIKPIRPIEKKQERIYDTDYEVGRPFLALAAEKHVSVLLVHHTNKTKSEDELDTISGSTGLAGGVDNILILKRARGSAEAVLYVTGRDIEREGRFPMSWDNGAAMWILSEESPASGMSPERKVVYELIRDRGPISSRDIASILNPGTGITRDSKEWMRVRKLCGELKKAGIISVNEKKELEISRYTGTHGTHRGFTGG